MKPCRVNGAPYDQLIEGSSERESNSGKLEHWLFIALYEKLSDWTIEVQRTLPRSAVPFYRGSVKKPQNKASDDKADAIKIIAENRRARFDYHVSEPLEAGIVLSGAEIKSARGGGMSIAESFARFFGDELFLVNAHIKEYSHSGRSVTSIYNPTRSRKLLLHKNELERLKARVEQKGFTLVVLKVYLKRGRAKVEVALGKGKDAPDRREATRKREADREMARSIKSVSKG